MLAPRPPRTRAARFIALVMMGTASAAHAQDRPPAPPPVDTAGLSQEGFGVMEMLYEATIFNVDVLTVRLELGVKEAARLQEAASGRPWDAETRNALADLVLDARDALVSVRFHRDVGLDRFLEGMADGVRIARAAGLVPEDHASRVVAEARRDFRVLEDRGIRDGDTFWYRVRGDSLHVAVQARDGEGIAEVRGHGPEHRLTLLGTYMAPGSDFREKLLQSLPAGG
ncbi:MAG TPA: hypothetical protein VLA43_13000 [Longimicrobiales bacterium]|nr:hypothetical protein [Longimicrobiales bacterium]